MLHVRDLGHPNEFPYHVVLVWGAVHGLLDPGVETFLNLLLDGLNLGGDEDSASCKAHTEFLNYIYYMGCLY